MWRKFKNQKSEMADFLDFPLPSLWFNPFFCRCCFHGEICRSKLPVLKIKKKNVFFIQQNLVLRINFYRFFPHPSCRPVQEDHFPTPNFYQGYKMGTYIIYISTTWLVYKLSQLSTSLSYMCTIIAIKHMHENFNFDIWST